MMKEINLNIGGLTPFSTIDFPNHLATIVYTQGCNFRCPYCHNLPLVDCLEIPISYEKIYEFLQARKRIIDGVVITGGEPTLQKELPAFCAWLRNMGFAVKLDTNGTKPLMLKLLIEKHLVDYIAMDIKAPWDKYQIVTHTSFPIELIQQSVSLLKETGFPCEFRTTVHSGLLTFRDLEKIVHIVGQNHLLCLQVARPTPFYKEKNEYTKENLEGFIKKFPKYKLEVR
ncbi:anaerobic ribonucleoside-triphosphate reductase activating protein [Candidatus Desulfofervidus auxilii]|uniref:Anaerobic ribonucleoside-triphosphate reductase activating protein n=1 Tax=Desulfofervidus auxilii TaxID=1621989 RepID=A0A7U4QKQ6_DESA2|nr:anaerobic ribonucleoside-triphosphate reductase activating protein [Candidatus Desulfofervidus auxilii]AMM41150.1 anaerobic ribonucleoside-triphosphate reductase activating protein [Candidatus Desulfofervidus auxilii]